MRKLLLLAVAIFVAAPAVFSAPACEEAGPLTLQSFLSGDLSGGCISQDKLFTVTEYTGDVAEGDVQVQFSVDSENGLDFHEALFQGGWSTPFSIVYTISVVNSPRVITAVDLDFTTRGTSSPTVTQLNTPTALDAPGGVLLNPMQATRDHRPVTGYFDNVTSVTATISGTGGYVGQVSNTWTQSAVPEPTTYALMGAGLLGLGLLRRRM